MTKRDDLVIRRRNKLRRHTTVVSNVILRGYHHVSDHAKLTYLVIDSYDWPDEDGFAKGHAWPSIATIAAERGKSYVSIWRDIKELAAAGLLTVESGQLRGATNVYWIEDPTVEEFDRYLARRRGGSERGITESKDPVEPLTDVKDPALATLQNPALAESKDKESQPKQSKPKKVFSASGWTAESLWAAVVADLRPTASDRRWLEVARISELAANVLVVTTPTTFGAEWLATRLRDRLASAAQRLLKKDVHLQIEVDNGA